MIIYFMVTVHNVKIITKNIEMVLNETDRHMHTYPFPKHEGDI